MILRGEPMLEIALVQVKHPLLRCVRCAGEPVPENLPPLPEPPSASDAITPVAEVAREWVPYRDDD